MRATRPVLSLVVSCGMFLLALFAVGVLATQPSFQPRWLQQWIHGTNWYPPEEVELAGISDFELLPVEAVQLDAAELVIGVCVEGDCRAYLLEALSGDPSRHIVNDLFGQTPISVTYCDRNGCARVFKGPSSQRPLPLNIGGWMAEQQLALLLDRRRFAHSSNEIPLEDYPFEVATWSEWKSAHPDGKIYTGTRDGA